MIEAIEVRCSRDDRTRNARWTDAYEIRWRGRMRRVSS